MKETELKPCPFCGGRGLLWESRVRRTLSWYVYCENCYIRTVLFDNLDESVETWNRRTTDERPEAD